jgi:hypothetical protein
VLNLASNNLGESVLAAGWRSKDYDDMAPWVGPEEQEQDEKPEGQGSQGIIAIANAIPDMGALLSVNLLKNKIGIEQAQELVKIMQSNEKLITLCGLSKEETKLDFSGQKLDAGDAVLIANDISDMGALTTLDISMNELTRGAFKSGYGYSGNHKSHYETDMTGMTTLLGVLNFPLPHIFLCRHYRRCRCRHGYGGHDKPQSCVEWSWR